MVFRQNEQGFAYGITFIDNRRKAVFNGSNLGKGYAVKAIIERLGTSDKLVKPELRTYLKPPTATTYLKRDESKSYLIKPEETNILKDFLSKSTQDFSFGAHPKKKKKKKGQQNDQQQSLKLKEYANRRRYPRPQKNH